MICPIGITHKIPLPAVGFFHSQVLIKILQWDSDSRVLLSLICSDGTSYSSLNRIVTSRIWLTWILICVDWVSGCSSLDRIITSGVLLSWILICIGRTNCPPLDRITTPTILLTRILICIGWTSYCSSLDGIVTSSVLLPRILIHIGRTGYSSAYRRQGFC